MNFLRREQMLAINACLGFAACLCILGILFGGVIGGLFGGSTGFLFLGGLGAIAGIVAAAKVISSQMPNMLKFVAANNIAFMHATVKAPKKRLSKQDILYPAPSGYNIFLPWWDEYVNIDLEAEVLSPITIETVEFWKDFVGKNFNGSYQIKVCRRYAEVYARSGTTREDREKSAKQKAGDVVRNAIETVAKMVDIKQAKANTTGFAELVMKYILTHHQRYLRREYGVYISDLTIGTFDYHKEFEQAAQTRQTVGEFQKTVDDMVDHAAKHGHTMSPELAWQRVLGISGNAQEFIFRGFEGQAGAGVGAAFLAGAAIQRTNPGQKMPTNQPGKKGGKP